MEMLLLRTFPVGLAGRGIDTSKGNECFLGMKAADIPIPPELRPKGEGRHRHTHDNRILGQRGGQSLHLRANRSQGDEVCPQLRNGSVNEDPDGLRVGDTATQFNAKAWIFFALSGLN